MRNFLRVSVLILFFLLSFSTYQAITKIYKVATDFKDITGKSVVSYLPKLISSLNNNKWQTRESFNFIILGLDPRNDSIEKTETTDTIIFGSYKFDTNKVDLISLPRDLWSYKTSEKINHFYPNALKSNDPFKSIKDNFKTIIGQDIDKVIIIKTADLISLTELVGGVDVTLEKGFTDNEYPNPEYIKNPNPKTPIYKTVSFPSGLIHLDASNVTEFVRSRKGAQTAQEGGTDIGRIKRQQLLIDSLLGKLRSNSFISDKNNLFRLLSFWNRNIETDFSEQDLIDLGIYKKQSLLETKIFKTDLPIGNNKDSGVIYHPEKLIQKQWVYIPNEETYSSLQQFIKTTIEK